MSEIRVALVDDHPVVLAGMKALLQAAAEIRLVGEATTGSAALQVIRDTTSLPWNQVSLADEGRVARVRRIPVLGRIAAGEPLKVGEGTEPVGQVKTAQAGLPKDPDLFSLEVDGDSMVGANIDSGDLVVVSPRLASTMAGGQVAVCRTYGEEITLKHCWRTNDGYLLRAANPHYPDIELAAGDCEVLGVVVRILKGSGARLKPWRA